MSFIHTLLYDSHSSQLTHHPSKQQSASRNSFEFPLASSAPWKLHTMQCVCTTHCIIIKHTRFSFAKLNCNALFVCTKRTIREKQRSATREVSFVLSEEFSRARAKIWGAGERMKESCGWVESGRVVVDEVHRGENAYSFAGPIRYLQEID